MIPRERFFAMRLGMFFPSSQIRVLVDWEFKGRTWVGEAVGFSEWLRLADEPSKLRSASLDFKELDSPIAQEILDALELQIVGNMTLGDLTHLLGAYSQVETFLPDRKSYIFELHDPDPFIVDCTVHDKDGLIYLVLLALP